MAQPQTFTRFEPALFQFLEELKRNNNRDWFQKNKSRYENEVMHPALAFIEAMQPGLRKISPHFCAVPKRVGGSLMRIYRDTRFAKDKQPYKTNVGIQFRHELGRDVHAPGFYVHLEADECFLGVGTWHPDSESLANIRTRIDEHPAAWKRARNNKRFNEYFDLAGESLKTAPRDYDKDHPLIEDLRRKDFIAVQNITRKEVLSKSFLKDVCDSFAASKPFMRFLCEAIRVPF